MPTVSHRHEWIASPADFKLHSSHGHIHLNQRSHKLTLHSHGESVETFRETQESGTGDEIRGPRTRGARKLKSKGKVPGLTGLY